MNRQTCVGDAIKIEADADHVLNEISYLSDLTFTQFHSQCAAPPILHTDCLYFTLKEFTIPSNVNFMTISV